MLAHIPVSASPGKQQNLAAKSPVSRRGCWLSLGVPQKSEHQPLGPGLYLRSNHLRPVIQRELMLIQPMHDGKPVKYNIVAAPELVRLQVAGGGIIEAAFEAPGTLRLRGRGAALRLSVRLSGGQPGYGFFSVVQPAPEGRTTVNLRWALRRYECAPLQGTLSVNTGWDGERATHGEHALARSIAERFCATCRKSGFAENFDALSGASLRDPCYTWTASSFLILAQRLGEKR